MEYLKCDASGCGFKVQVKRISQEHVGEACPRCGANLLTQEDYDQWVEHFQDVLPMLARLGGEVDGDDLVAVDANLHENRLRIAINSQES